jgi:hypothetical protein
MSEILGSNSPGMGVRLSFSEFEAQSNAPHRKQKPKLSEMEGSLPPVKWSKDRPKPALSFGVWDDDTADELAKYIDWHKRHPHCVTPRKLEEGAGGNGHLAGKKMIDEENPDFFYGESAIRMKPIPKEYLPAPVGGDCDMESVSSFVTKTEYRSYHSYQEEDPWFVMSVKDNLEQSHMDGTHTTVRMKPPKAKKMTALQKEVTWQQHYYSDYEGGGPTVSDQQKSILNQLSLTDKAVLIGKRQSISPWEDKKVFTRYTANGTALKKFQQNDVEDKIKMAFELHKNPFATEKSYRAGLETASQMSSRQSSRRSLRSRFSFSRPSGAGAAMIIPVSPSTKSMVEENNSDKNINNNQTSEKVNSKDEEDDSFSPFASGKKSKKSKKSKKQEPVVVDKRDKYDIMKEKFTATNDLAKYETNILKLAKKITKKSKQTKAVIDTSLNIVEACDKLRILKVTTLLLTKQCEAECLTPDEESLFLHCFQRAIRMDNVTSNLKVEDAKQDSSDRKKLQKILEILIKYEAEIDSLNSKDSLAALHMAVIADNAKMIYWLIRNDCDPYLLTNSVDYLTPIMMAAKYGNVQAVATLVENGVDIDARNPFGVTALHIAAGSGQTRTALFLLRVGASKKLKDSNGKVAADYAQDK